MADEVILTKDGLKKLKDELHLLKTKKRKEIAEQIKNAKEYGDISENAEYDDAKNEQAFVEGRILEIEKMTKNAKVVQRIQKCDKVSLGCTVEVSSNGKKEKYTIVGSQESNPLEGRISHESPLGKALIDKMVGDTVDLELPDRTMQYRIVSIG